MISAFYKQRERERASNLPWQSNKYYNQKYRSSAAANNMQNINMNIYIYMNILLFRSILSIFTQHIIIIFNLTLSLCSKSLL